ncbi:propanediol utilization protein [Rhodovulum steppense]|uniref:propanediol utilization protein n=1 Tax=Rhodovulum steppense TaxID=540251 RepID=UPI001FB4470F|nr:propanediol utilization protein [Rhodovulum steppense]
MLARDQVRALFAAVRGGTPRGRLRLYAGMPPGGGAGASTASLLAVLRCLAAGRLSPETEAALCLAIEGASDPLMYPVPDRLLWAPRVGCVLGRLPALPRLDVVGGFKGPGRRTDPTDRGFADIADLLAEWRQATGPGAFAALATESARRNHALRGGPDPEPLLRAGRRLGALGIVAAHTGSALGLLFAPGTMPDDAAAVLRGLGLRHVLRFRAGGRG